MITVGARIQDRNEFELYFPIFVTLFSAPVALGATPVPGSINALVDPAIARAWSIALLLGAIAHIVGMAWRQPADYPLRHATTGLVVEMIGLTMQAAACFVFIIALLYRSTQTGDVSGLIGAGFVTFALAACSRRAWKVHKALQLEQLRKDLSCRHEHPERP